MNDDDALTAIDIQVITVTIEDGGTIGYDHSGLSVQEAVWALDIAKTMVQLDYLYPPEDEEEEDD